MSVIYYFNLYLKVHAKFITYKITLDFLKKFRSGRGNGTKEAKTEATNELIMADPVKKFVFFVMTRLKHKRVSQTQTEIQTFGRNRVTNDL